MQIELHPAMAHSYGSAEESTPELGAARAAESVQAFDPVYLTRVPEAIVAGGHLISGDGTILSWGAPGRAAWRPLRRLTRLNGTYFNLTGLWSEGYAHWLLDFLPRLMALAQLDRSTTRILVSEPFPDWKAETISKAGIDLGMVEVIRAEPTQVETLYLLGPLGSPAHCHPLAASWLRATFLSPLFDGQPTRRLYISRRRAATRRLRNEKELLEALGPLGFETIDAELLSFDQQIEAFQRASIVVGPHGAGLANLVFCPLGADVVELSAPNYPQFTYEWLSSHCGLHHRTILGQTVDARLPSAPVGRQDFAIDPAQVVRCVTDLGVPG